MGKNLEIKIAVENLNELKDISLTKSAIETAVLNQKDVYYNYEKGLLKLRIENGKNQLIVYNRNEDGKERWSDYKLMDCGPNAEEVFATLHSVRTVVEKVRTLYMYKNTRIHFDEVKHLGSFLELESVVTDSEEESRKEFNEVVEFLNLDLSKQILDSYSGMMLK